MERILHGQDVASCMHGQAASESDKVWNASEQETSEKAVTTSQGQKRRGERAAIAHWPCWFDKMSRCNTPRKIPGTFKSGETSVNNCAPPRGASLNTGFQRRFYQSLMLKFVGGQPSPQWRKLLSLPVQVIWFGEPRLLF